MQKCRWKMLSSKFSGESNGSTVLTHIWVNWWFYIDIRHVWACIGCLSVDGWRDVWIDARMNGNKYGSSDNINWKSPFWKVCMHSWVSDRTSVGVGPLPLAVMVTALWPNYLPSFSLNILTVPVKNLSFNHWTKETVIILHGMFRTVHFALGIQCTLK